MSAINFPSLPAGQNPVNTFSPTSTPEATSNGITYVYDGTKWSASSSGGGGGGSQDLQSVTDVGNTTTNGATFAGDILTGDFSPYGTKVKGINGITIRTDSNSAREVFGIFDEDNSSAEKVAINADGSASFAGSLVQGNASGNSNFTVTNGLTILKREASPTNPLLQMGNASTTYGKISINAAASFTEVNVGTQGAWDKIALNENGNATFDGNVSSKSYFVSDRDATGKSLYSGSVNGVESLNIVADGSIYAGNSSGSGTAGPGNVNIQLNASDGSAMFAGQVTTDKAFVSKGNDAANYIFQGLNTSGTEVIRMNNDGSAVFTGTVTATVVPPSDARFKENIEPAKPQLADVVALGGILKNYDWNDQAPLNEELRHVRQLGLIAQEVAEVCPSIVKDINRTKTVEITPAVYDAEGEVSVEAVTEQVDDSYKGLSQEALVMKLIGSVAELSAEIDSNKARLNERDAAILELQNQVQTLLTGGN